MNSAILVEGLYLQEVIFVNEQNRIEKRRIVAPNAQQAMMQVRRERPRVIITGGRRIIGPEDEVRDELSTS